MKLKYKLEFTLFILLITLIPVFLYTIILTFEYRKNIINRNLYYLESIRNTNIELFMQNYNQTIDRIENKINSSNTSIDKIDIKNIMENSLYIEGVSIYTKDYKKVYSIEKEQEIFSNEEIIESLKKANFSQNYFLENIDSERPFNLLIFNYFNKWYIAVTLNYKLFDIVESVQNGFKIDIYNDKYRLIKSSYKRRINIKEIDDFTKKITEGLEKSEIINGKLYTYSPLSFNGAEFYILIQNEDGVLKNYRMELVQYTVFIILFSMSLSFLISWRFLQFINRHIAKKIISYDYDDYHIKILENQLGENIKNVDKILKYYLDFQVLKDDLEEAKKSLSHKKKHIERDDENGDEQKNSDTKNNLEDRKKT